MIAQNICHPSSSIKVIQGLTASCLHSHKWTRMRYSPSLSGASQPLCRDGSSADIHSMQVDIIASRGLLELCTLVEALRLRRRGYISVDIEQLC